MNLNKNKLLLLVWTIKIMVFEYHFPLKRENARIFHQSNLYRYACKTVEVLL